MATLPDSLTFSRNRRPRDGSLTRGWSSSACAHSSCRSSGGLSEEDARSISEAVSAVGPWSMHCGVAVKATAIVTTKRCGGASQTGGRLSNNEPKTARTLFILSEKSNPTLYPTRVIQETLLRAKSLHVRAILDSVSGDKHHQNPFQEREYQSADQEDVYNRWYEDQRHMDTYKVSLLLPDMNSKTDKWLDFLQFWPTMTTRHCLIGPHSKAHFPG